MSQFTNEQQPQSHWLHLKKEMKSTLSQGKEASVWETIVRNSVNTSTNSYSFFSKNLWKPCHSDNRYNYLHIVLWHTHTEKHIHTHTLNTFYFALWVGLWVLEVTQAGKPHGKHFYLLSHLPGPYIKKKKKKFKRCQVRKAGNECPLFPPTSTRHKHKHIYTKKP